LVNLLITMRCNRSCNYCFAKEKLNSYNKRQAETEISIKNVEKVVQFLSKTYCDTIQLAGGEPTIHSRFKEIVLILLKSNIRVNLLTNSLWNPEFNKFFDEISPTLLGFLLNIDNPKTYNTAEQQRLDENLAFLSKRGNITLSFNLFEKKPDYNYIFDLVKKYGFKNLRLSFSMPVNFEGKKNTYLQIEDYKESAKFIMDFVHRAEQMDATVGMDNAVPVCMFNSEDLSELMVKDVVSPNRNFVCYPAIDIGPDLSVWRCFGTSKLFNKKLDDFSSLTEIYDYYQQVSRLYQFKFFPLKECETCQHAIKERCQGGCIGFAEAKCAELGISILELQDKEILQLKPTLSNQVSLHRYSLPDTTATINFHDGCEMEIPSAIANLLTHVDGKTTIMQALKTEISGPYPNELDVFDEFLTELSSKKVIPIIRRLIEKKVLLTE
jgi:MoaA/NifB/PqqE/SkfB family radical SAM enzyme